MRIEFVVSIVAGVIVTLAFFLLVSYIVRSLTRTKSANTKLLAGGLAAVGSLMVVLPIIVYALYAVPTW
ncbi:hypothetical protein ACIBHY_30215 [Nonomuraea sp. NPDC050547]|uniref:hypothetical protein n=1 Tax=Nonomuraea sp. NPDC050547 TaxID=3364368 RepID=UPI00379A6F4C